MQDDPFEVTDMDYNDFLEEYHYWLKDPVDGDRPLYSALEYFSRHMLKPRIVEAINKSLSSND